MEKGFGGYIAIFLFVLGEQLGLPIPAMPILVGAGALAGAGRLGLFQVIAVVMTAALIGDLVWYELGRRRGSRVLRFLCRISLEPDSCVRRTQDVFGRRGAWTLVLAKFVPGLSTLAPPLAGVARMSPARFLLLDGLGALLWAVGFTGLGFLFSRQLGSLAVYSERIQFWLPILLIGGLAAYIGWKYFQRRRFLSGLRAARITADHLKAKLDAGDPVIIVDLRHHLDLEPELEMIPGALRLEVREDGELDHRAADLPIDRDIVLYCA